MQHHTLGSGTAEFQVTWPPKLREGTYLVKNVRARFEYRKTIAAHEKQVIMQEKTQPCASLWRKTLRPKRVRFLAIDAPIVDYVCLPLYHLTFLGSYQPLWEFSWRKKKEKARKKGSGFIDKILTWVSGLPRSATTPIHHFVQYAKVTLLEISPCQTPMCGVAYSCSYALLFLCTLALASQQTARGRRPRIKLRYRSRSTTWQLVVLVPRSTDTHVAKHMAISRNGENFWRDWKLHNNTIDLLSSDKVGFRTVMDQRWVQTIEPGKELDRA